MDVRHYTQPGALELVSANPAWGEIFASHQTRESSYF